MHWVMNHIGLSTEFFNEVTLLQAVERDDLELVTHMVEIQPFSFVHPRKDATLLSGHLVDEEGSKVLYYKALETWTPVHVAAERACEACARSPSSGRKDAIADRLCIELVSKEEPCVVLAVLAAMRAPHAFNRVLDLAAKGYVTGEERKRNLVRLLLSSPTEAQCALEKKEPGDIAIDPTIDPTFELGARFIKAFGVNDKWLYKYSASLVVEGLLAVSKGENLQSCLLLALPTDWKDYGRRKREYDRACTRVCADILNQMPSKRTKR